MSQLGSGSFHFEELLPIDLDIRGYAAQTEALGIENAYAANHKGIQLSYSVTYDEKATGFFSSYASAYTDAPFSLSTPYTLAQTTPAYGLLTATGYVADSDAYSMGNLLNGTYSVTAVSSSWFFGTGYSSFSTPSIAIYNSVGTSVASSSYAVSFNVTTPGTYYAVVSGSTYQSSQYALSIVDPRFKTAV